MISRIISLGMAGGLSWAFIYGAPVIGNKLQKADKLSLITILLGIIGGFAHGLGYTPRHIILKILFNRWVARLLMIWPLFFY